MCQFDKFCAALWVNVVKIGSFIRFIMANGNCCEIFFDEFKEVMKNRCINIIIFLRCFIERYYRLYHASICHREHKWCFSITNNVFYSFPGWGREVTKNWSHETDATTKFHNLWLCKKRKYMRFWLVIIFPYMDWIRDYTCCYS